MIRDRFEKLINAISTGTAIDDTRTRFEEIINAIATKIGEISGGGGASGTTLDLLASGSFKYGTPAVFSDDISDYKLLVLQTSLSGTYYYNTIVNNTGEFGCGIAGQASGWLIANMANDYSTLTVTNSSSGIEIVKIYGVK